MEIPKPIVQSRLFLAKHVAHEGIREWFMREDWLLTEREVRMLLTLRRCVAARYYNEWGPVDPEATAVDSWCASMDLGSCNGSDQSIR